MPPSLANKTVLAIESALADERTAAITEIVTLIQQLAAKAFSISIEDLSQIVSRDPTITEKVISAANTLGYNPTGTPVTTISDAIHTVGFEKIRNLAISLMLAENAGTLVNTYEQRNVAALCVCSGMLAQELYRDAAEESRKEFLFVCASLRSYGRLLLSTFLVEDYRLALTHALETSENEAFRLVFGLTPLDLARRILQKTNLPHCIQHSLRDLTAELLNAPPANLDNEALVLSELSLDLSKALLDESIGPDKLNAAITSVTRRFARSYPVDAETINDAILKVESNIEALNRAINLDPNISPASAKLRARIEGKPLPEPPDRSRILPLLKAKPIGEMSAAERRNFSDATFTPALETVGRMRTSRSKIDLDVVFASVLKAFTQAVNLENCLFFTRDPFDAECFSASHGSGKLFERIRQRPYIGPAKRDIFSICLTRQEVILIQDITTGKVGTVVPDWIHLAGQTSSFIVIPISTGGQLQTILVGTVSNGRKIDLSETDIKHLRSLRSELVKIFSTLHAQSAGPSYGTT